MRKIITRIFHLLLISSLLLNRLNGQVDLSMIHTGYGCSPNSFFPNSMVGFGTINLINNGNLNFLYMNNCISNLGIQSFSGTCYSTNVNYNQEWTCSNGLTQIVNLGDALSDWPYRSDWKWLGPNCCLDQLIGSDFFGGYLEVDFYSKNAGPGYYRYIKWDILDPLVEGMEYTFQMSIAPFSIPSTTSKVHVSNIGVAFESTLPTYALNDFGLFLGDQVTPDFEIMSGNIVSSVEDTIEFQFTGNGENYIIIGIFEPEGALQFGTSTNDDSEARYLIDNVRLFRTDCPNPIARFSAIDIVEEYNCPGEEIELSPYSGVAPFEWTIDGIVQEETSDVLSFTADEDYHYITITSDTGICATTDTAYIFPQIFHHGWPSDTIMSCGSPVEFGEDYYLENLESNNWYATWTGIDNDSFYEISDNSTSPDLTPQIDQPGTYVFYVDYFYGNFCNYTDTLVILEDPGLILSEENEPLLFSYIEDENCQNMSDGSISFNDSSYPGNLHYFWPQELAIPSNSSMAQNLSSGTYTVSVIDEEGRCQVFDLLVNFQIDSCAKIQGYVNLDLNNNCLTELSDHPHEMTKVTAAPLGNFAYTDTTGYFEILVPPGTYNLEREITNEYIGPFCQNVDQIVLEDPGQISTDVIFQDTIRNFVQCVTIENMYVGPHLQIDQSSSIGLEIKNCGDTIVNGMLSFVNSNPGITIFPENVPGYLYTSADTSYFEFSNLEGFESLYLFIPVAVDNLAELIGTHCFFPLNLYTDFEQESFVVDYLILEAIIYGAYDPNDKTCIPEGFAEQNYIDIETDKLLYTIRFQNTGNYPATTVRIVDSLSNVLDPSSFELVSHSHNVVISQYNGIMEFLFPEIMLPDSGTNETESHGQITFYVNLLPGLEEFTEIQNTAYIYFDNNPAIITNTVNHTLYDCAEFDPQFDISPPNFCQPEEILVNFSEEWIENSEWYIDGDLYSVENSPEFIVDPGEFEVVRIIYNPLCGVRTDTILLPVYLDYPLLLEFESPIICDENGTSLTVNNYPGEYDWYLNNELFSQDEVIQVSNAGFYHAIANLGECTLYSDTLEIVNGITPPIELIYENNQLIASSLASYEYFYWYHNGLLVSEGSESAYSPTASGNYAVLTYNEFNCPLTSNTLTIFVDLNENNFESVFSIYPNPVESILNIETELKGAEYKIYSLLGGLMLTGRLNNQKNQIDVSNWPKGVYFLELKFEGERMAKSKISIF